MISKKIKNLTTQFFRLRAQLLAKIVMNREQADQVYHLLRQAQGLAEIAIIRRKKEIMIQETQRKFLSEMEIS